MTVALINPNYQRAIEAIAQTTVGPPMGLAYLAGALRAADINVRIVDANALRLGAAETIARSGFHDAELIGLTATTPTIDACYELSRGLRLCGYKGPVVIGGPHPSALPEQTLRTEHTLTAVCRGEGEQTIVELVRALREGRPMSDVPGMVVRDGEDVVRTAERTETVDVDSLAPPARDLLPLPAYLSPDGSSTMTVIASRGCPAPCSYCAVPRHFGRHLRRRDPDQIADEIEGLVKAHNTRWIDFIDDTFTWNRRWVLALCEALTSRGLHKRIQWLCLTRVDRVDLELLQAMRQAGCRRIEMGIECASPDALEALKKGIDEDQVIDAFQTARKAGMETLAFAMVNVPGESLDDIERTRKLLAKARPDFLQLTFCTPYPGTPLYVEALAKGMLRTTEFKDFRFLRKVVLDNGVLSRRQVLDAHKRLQRSFWLSPGTVLRMSKRALTEPGARLATLRMARKAWRHL